MPFQNVKQKSAEDRFREAFERLKDGFPLLLKEGSLVTQNNVAREAACDPSALRKSRFPALIREIQAYVELHPKAEDSKANKVKKRLAANRSTTERMHDALRQRDQAQSILLSANIRIVELTEEVQSLRAQLEEFVVKPIDLNFKK